MSTTCAFEAGKAVAAIAAGCGAGGDCGGGREVGADSLGRFVLRPWMRPRIVWALTALVVTAAVTAATLIASC